MKTNEILKTAIEKAQANGWKNAPIWDDQMDWAYYSDHDGGFGVASTEQIIFDHEFAKAFWGTKRRGYDFTTKREIQEWDSHLQEMVLEEDPISYLERFI